MDAGIPTDTFLDESIGRLREHREEMALWLALEVLQLNPVALEDAELVDRLIGCQDRVQERLRAKVAEVCAAAPQRKSNEELPEASPDREPPTGQACLDAP